MKRTFQILVGILLIPLPLSLVAQSAPPPAATNMVIGYQIGEQGGNYRNWLKVVQSTDARGNTVLTTNLAYVQLATGLNYKDPSTGKWLSSKEEIDGYPGGAIAQYGQHKVIFANNLNTAGAIDLQTPDGKELQSDILGLSYYDTASGKSVLIAQVQDSQGQIVSSNKVLYPDAFKGLKASVLYRYTLAGLEQDVVLLEQPPSPKLFGLSPTSCVLQVLTEFTAAPKPIIRAMPDATNDVLADEMLDFGAMKMVRGKAFLLGTNSPTAQICKKWLNVGGRTVLVESLPLASIRNSLSKLPAFAATSFKPAAGSVQYAVSDQRLLPRPRTAATTRTKMKLALSGAPTRGFDLDLILVNSSSSPYTFQGDTTYLVMGPVNFSSDVTFEGGSVIKYLPFPYSSLNIYDPGQIICESAAYRPTVFTASDDNSVGTAIGSGNPAGVYANPAIAFFGSNSGGSALTLHDFRISYATTAIDASGISVNVTATDGQILNCGTGFNLPGQVGANLTNVLFGDVSDPFSLGIASVHVYNSTFCQPSGSYEPLAAGEGNGRSAFLTLENCILANIRYYSQNMPQPVTGDHNGFYNSGGNTTFGTPAFTTDNDPFLSAAGGSYYLATNSDGTDASGFRNKGVGSVNPQTTTYPPVVYDSTTISSVNNNDNFTSQVPRDTDTPDLGYHYYPLDYVFENCLVDSSMTFPPGTAIGWQGQGLTFSGSSLTITFNGTAVSPSALDPCYFVRCNTVQESDQSGDGTGIAGFGSGLLDAVAATFTHFSAVGDIATFFDANGVFAPLYNCEFWDGLIGGTVNNEPQLNGQNCLFDRSSIEYLTTGSSLSTYFTLANCTVHGGSLQINPGLHSFYIHDCAFDNTRLSGVDSSYAGDASYNAYISGADYLPGADPGSNPYSDVFVNGSFNWQTGPLGDFYLPDDPLAQDGTLLINKGDNYANYISVNVGNGQTANLGDFTTQVNLLQEGSTTVDIGYHYPGLDMVSISVPVSGTDNAIEPSSQPGCPNTNGTDGYFDFQNNGMFPVTASYTPTGAAQEGVDYQSLAPHTVALDPGSPGSAQINVVPNYDGKNDFDELLTLTLDSSSDYDIDSAMSSANILIEDNPCNLPFADFPFTVVTNLDGGGPNGIDYWTNGNQGALVISIQNGDPDFNGSPDFIQMGVDSSGALTIKPWTTITGLAPNNEVKLATVKTSANGFAQGQMFFGNYDTANNVSYVGEASPDGTTVNNQFAALTSGTFSDTYIRGSLYVDQTGVFNNDLIVVTGDGSSQGGGVWEIGASPPSDVTLLADITQNPHHDLEGVITLPTGTLPNGSTWGPWAGKIVAGAEDAVDQNGQPESLIYTIDPYGNVASYPLGSGTYQIHPEDFDIIPPEPDGNGNYQDLYVCDDSIKRILKIDGKYLSGHSGDLLITDEGSDGSAAGLFVVRWDSSTSQFLIWFIPPPTGSGFPIESSTFAPLDLPSYPIQ